MIKARMLLSDIFIKALFLLIALLVSSQINAYGCMSGNCQNGTGTFWFSNGNEYVGEFKYFKRHGKGTFTLADGTKYVGDWLDGSATGKGTITYADGDKYVGEFKDNERHGKGVVTYANGTTKTGIWENDEYLGVGEKYKRIYNACLLDKG